MLIVDGGETLLKGTYEMGLLKVYLDIFLPRKYVEAEKRNKTIRIPLRASKEAKTEQRFFIRVFLCIAA